MITITKGVAQTETREGYQRRMPLEKFIAAINPPQLDLVLPNALGALGPEQRNLENIILNQAS